MRRSLALLIGCGISLSLAFLAEGTLRAERLHSDLPPAAHYCNIALTGADRCDAVLPAAFMNKPVNAEQVQKQFDLLKGAYDRLHDRPGSAYRKPNCPGCELQYAYTLLNDSARVIDLNPKDHLPIVMSALRYLPNSASADFLYQVGSGLRNSFEERAVLFIALPKDKKELIYPPNAPPDYVADTVVGKWAIVHLVYKHRTSDGVFHPDTVVFENPTGTGRSLIVSCGTVHDPKGMVATFTTCEKVEELMRIAKLLNRSLANTIALFSCEPALLGAKATVERCREQVKKQQAQAISIANRNRPPNDAGTRNSRAVAANIFDAAKASLDDDPYWFPCAAGCCTAGFWQ